MILPRHRAAIFVHGCFWHRHEGCRYTTTPSTRPEFWVRKFDANSDRDRRSERALLQSGWRVVRVWECAIRRAGSEAVAVEVRDWLVDGSGLLDIGEASNGLEVKELFGSTASREA